MIRSLSERAILPLLVVLLLLLEAAPAAAQARGTDTIPVINIDSLVVSVLGGPVRIGDSPYPISVVGKRELRQGKTGMFLEEALEGLPGVQVQNRFNYAVGERVSIRGFGARAPFGVRGIHVEVDGIPATLPDGQSTLDHVNIGSLGRVEALRGPASALYGNASGGVLLFETEMPAQGAAREEATIVAGSHGLLRFQSTTSGTLGETGYLVSLNKLNFEGFRRDQANGDPYGSADRFHLNARLVQPMGGGELGITFNHLELDAENPGSLDLTLFEEDPRQVRDFSYTNNGTGKEVQQTQLGLTWTGPVGGLTAQAAVYGLTRDFLNPLPGDVVDVDRRSGGARLMLAHAMTSGDIGIEVRGGADVDFQDDDRREYDNNGGVPDALTRNETQSVRGVGVYLQTSVSMSERVSLMGGIRYDRTRFAVEDLFPVTPGTDEDDSGTRTMDAFNPTVGVHVAALPELGFFANYSASFQTPTTVELGNQETVSGGFNPNLEPQTGRTFEMGARGTVRDRVSYELTAFKTRLKNELIKFRNGDGRDYFQNAGSSTRNGMEAILRARLHDLVTGQASYTYINARFDEYTDRFGADHSGNKVPGLAPQQLQASLRLSPDAWYVVLATEYTDETAVNDPNDAPFAEAYTLFDIRVGGSALQLGGFEISPFAGVNNLTDETYVSSVAINAFGGRYYEPGPGRTFYVGGMLAVSR